MNPRRPPASEAIEAAKQELDELLVAARSAAEQIEHVAGEVVGAGRELVGVGRRIVSFARKFWSGRWSE